MQAVREENVARGTERLTLPGSPAPDSNRRPDPRDSTEIRTDTLLERLYEAGEELRAEQDRNRDLEERLRRLELASSLPPKPAQWGRLAYSLIGGLVLLVGAATAWLEAHTAHVESRVDNVAAKQSAQVLVTTDLSPRVIKIEEYIRGHAERETCNDSQVRSAFARATGYALTSLPEDSVSWASESLPRARSTPLWPAPVWFPVATCPREPAVP